MSVVSYGLTTRDRLKTFLGITGTTYDALLDSVINAATEFIEGFCNRRFQKTVYSNEVYDGTGSDVLVLKNYPVIVSTTTLQERNSYDNNDEWTTITSEDYFIKLNEGIIHYVGSGYDKRCHSAEFVAYPQHYRVSFTAGFDFNQTDKTLESVGLADLEYATWKLSGKIFNQRKTDSNVQSVSLGNYSVSFIREAMMDEEIKQILMRYKRTL